jgi:hypothetical protein
VSLRVCKRDENISDINRGELSQDAALTHHGTLRRSLKEIEGLTSSTRRTGTEPLDT